MLRRRPAILLGIFDKPPHNSITYLDGGAQPGLSEKLLQLRVKYSKVVMCQGTRKPENPTGKPDILGHPNPTRTRGVYTRTRPETRHSKPENPRYFQGIQNIEILTKKVVIFV